MNKVVDVYNTVGGIIISVLTLIFGEHWILFALYLLMQALDFVTGWAKARKASTESSNVGLVGIIKKLGYWVAIAVAFATSYALIIFGEELLNIDLSFITLMGWFTLACLFINECRSIIENLVEYGLNIPDILIKGLAVTQKIIEQKGDYDNDSDDQSK